MYVVGEMACFDGTICQLSRYFICWGRKAELQMVALLKENGEFTPMPVVFDTAKFEELRATMEAPAKAVPELTSLIRESRKNFVTVSK